MTQHKLVSARRTGAWRTLALAAILAAPATGMAQTMPADHAGHHSVTAPAGMSMSDQVTDLRAKVAKLQMELQHKQMGMAGGSFTGIQPMGGMSGGMSGATPGMGSTSSQPSGTPNMMQDMGAMMQEMGSMMQKMPAMEGKDGMGSMGAMNASGQAPGGGMKGMGPGMKMDSMMGMDSAMGMPPAQSMAASAALPGFPGASHLYHIGATDFFLDHPQHIALTTEQQAALNKAKEQALLAKSTADRAIEQAEQELWNLTAADQPDTTKIEAKISEIERLRGDERLGFIRAVGEANKLLTDEQRKILTGFAPPAPAMPGAPAGGMGGGGMKDM